MKPIFLGTQGGGDAITSARRLAATSTRPVAGKNFGIITNIVSGPDGNLYVTSLTNGAVYMIQ
jgi:hypothetical protein